jgi:hypothetical protein
MPQEANQDEVQQAFALTHQTNDASISAVMLDQEQPLEFHIELSKPEKDMLTMCEETIQAGIAHFMQVGEALAVIRKARLYKEQFLSFEDYCRERWGFGRYRALHFIQAAETGQALVTRSHSLAGLNVQQMRLLHPLEPEEQSAAMTKAREIGGKNKLATRHIAEAIKAIQPEEEEEDPIVAEGMAMTTSASASTTEMAMPTVTVDMITGCFDEIHELLEQIEYSEGVQTAFAKLRSMVLTVLKQQQDMEAST